jgi:Tfp pilus assembly protein PilX
MIPLRVRLGDDRGSALLISLVMIVVITILGLALFELGQIEGTQSGASLGDARAFELAQAGMERAIRELSNAFLADSYGSESWVDGTNRPTCTVPCETGVYQTMNLANNTLPASGTDPGGTFVVELKQVLVAEANNPVSQGAAYTYPYGQTCIPSTPANPTVCANLMFVRSTGTVAGPPGYTAVRTVQALVKAYSTSYFAGGLTAERNLGSSGPAIDGRVLIGGSIEILGTTSISPAFQISGGGSMGMRNSWNDLWTDPGGGAAALARLTPRQLICPVGVDCTGGVSLVESLGAQLKIYGNTSNNMVTLNGGTDLGISTVQTPLQYGDATVGLRYGKGRIDGVYVSSGCTMPCTTNAFTFNGGSTIYVDGANYTRPYPYRPPKLPLRRQKDDSSIVLYPTVADPTVIGPTAYTDWWASYLTDHVLTNPNLANAPIPATAYPYDNNYARINASNANGGSCGATYTTGTSLGNIISGGLDDGTGDGVKGFCHTFKYLSKSDPVNPRPGEICWRRNVNSVSNNVANLPPNYTTTPTLEFGSPSCDVPTTPADPAILEFLRHFRLSRSGAADHTYQYRGAALIYLHDNNPVDIEQTLQTTCSTPAATPPCVGERFPENNLLIFVLRNGSVNIASSGDATHDVVDRFMAYVYTEADISVQKRSNLIGSLRAQQFCFNNASAGSCSVSGANGNPRFYQASFTDLRKIPAEVPASSGDSGNRWLVDVVPRFWIECRRGPGDVLPPTPTGTCQYQ